MNVKYARELRSRGYKLNGIARTLGVSVDEVRGALKTPRNIGNEKQQEAMQSLLSAGYDPEVVRANFVKSDLPPLIPRTPPGEGE